MGLIDDVEGVIEAVEATTEQVLARLTKLGNWDTAGPQMGNAAIQETIVFASPRWDGGWWADAKRAPAHPGRIGAPIHPWCTVVHTTDMVPEDFFPLAGAWQSKPGDGACAHFVIGRDAKQGVFQFVPITRNGNHAGGPGHGVFDTASVKNIHPNTVAVGIEIHCAGGLREINGVWRFVEDGACHGQPFSDDDVIEDVRPARAWHKVTDWQYQQLYQLLADLELVLAPVPAGAASRSTGEQVPPWAVPKSPRIVGHVSLDPEHRSDPWPPTCFKLFHPEAP